ncbi:MAG: ABC transporter permease [Oscillospiraceae bacterium]|nr:ABC transporter permease [Oscillospiraceae bacterium]
MRYILKKAGVMIVTLLIISLLAFLAFEIIPADPVDTILGTDYTEERAEALREELGLNVPLSQRYLNWLKGFFTGDLGISYGYRISVNELLEGKVFVTACLSAIAFVLVIIISIPVGIFLARFRGGIVDRFFSVLNQITMSVPPFFIGILFTSIFGLALKLFIVGDFVSFDVDPSKFFVYLFFAALAIALPKSAMTVKLLRSSIINEMGEDYVRTARARGNTSSGILWRHVLRNSMLPVITFLAVTLADIVAGSIIIEQVFTIPGIGGMLIMSIGNRDYPVVLSIIMLISALVLFVNFIADVVYQYIDPRIRLQ